jgi:hypothetical protein
MTKEYEEARAHLSTAIQNAAQCIHPNVGDQRATVCIATALVLIADELHTMNEQNKGVGVWRECVTRALTELCRYFGTERRRG